MRSLMLVCFIVIALVCFMYEIHAQEDGITQHDTNTNDEGTFIPSILLENVLNQDFDGISRALENGESIDVVNDNGWSGARFAVELAYTDMLRKLIELDADLNNADRNGVTPLMAAAQAGEKELVEILLRANANPLQAAADGNDAFNYAQKSGRNVIALLIAEASTIHAISANDMSQVLSSLRRGSFANIRNGAGWTPLMLASAMGDLEAAKEIINYGPDLDRLENDGWSALHFAADGGYDKIVDLLLKSGAKVHLRNKDEKTARDLAMDQKFLTIVDKIPEPDEEL